MLFFSAPFKPALLFRAGLLSIFFCCALHLPALAQLGEPDLSIMNTLRDDYGWGAAFGWGSGNPCPAAAPDWPDVICNNGRVVGIQVSCGANKLTTDFPAELNQLTELITLQVRGCWTDPNNPATAKDLTNLSKLNILRLNDNTGLTGTLPDFLGNSIMTSFPNFGVIEITNSGIGGIIPPDMPTNVIRFINQTRVGGTLPNNVPTVFRYVGNQLEGVLPPNWVNAMPSDSAIYYNKFDVVNTPPGPIDIGEPGWRNTQTVPPTDVQVTPGGPNEATLSWTPIGYTWDGGYYEVLASPTPGGPYTSYGTTESTGGKTATGLSVTGLPGGTNSFVVRTFTPAHMSNPKNTRRDNPNDLTSVNSAEVSAFICPGSILYVNDDAGGNDNGTSWANAFNDLQEALALAGTCSGITEIWVAEGTYKPTTGTDRNLSFSMQNGVAIYGGFPNTGNPIFADRDWAAHETILSGDIGMPGDNSDNSRRIIYNTGLDNTAILDGFTIRDASNEILSGGNQGGGMWNDGASPSIRNCTFRNNHVAFNGGGVANNNASPEFINCLFVENSARSGGAFRSQDGSPTLLNCTFVGNVAQLSRGDAIAGNFGSTNQILINCILWGNGGSNVFWNLNGATITASNSIIQGGYAPCTDCPGGDGNVDPLFVDAANGDNRLLACSPAIDAGNNAAVPSGITTDLDGNPRFFASGTVDVGAYEYPFPAQTPIGASHPTAADAGPDQLGCADGVFTLAANTPSVGTGLWSVESGTATISSPGSPNSTVNGIPAGASATLRWTVTNGSCDSFDEVVLTARPSTSIVYVNDDAGGNNDGTSWANAFNDLQEALALAGTCSGITEIWVAEGTYKPTTGTDRNISFSMQNGVAIYGGFPNTGNPVFADRDWAAHETILSGDIGMPGDDSDNSIHIFSNSNLDGTAILDGFTLSGGRANGPSIPTQEGGAMVNQQSSPTINNCTFINNFGARNGAAVMNSTNCSPVFTNCLFTQNTNGGAGDGVIFDFNGGGSLLINCTISGNSTRSAVLGNFANVNTQVQNCILWENSNNNFFGDFTISHSIVQGGFGACSNCPGGDGNVDPLFVDAANGNLRLRECSPAIDAGDNAANSSSLGLDGNPRVFNAAGTATIDLGAYEYPSSYDFTSSCTILYVNDDASGDNDGSSWANAFNDLQDALNQASNNSSITQIWVAEGTYKPTTGTDRGISFSMVNGIGIYGGFPGLPGQEGDFSVRDWAANETVLSGDIGTPGDNSDNSRRIIYNTGLDNTAILDGFTIRDASNDFSGQGSQGGGMWNNGASPSVRNCTFRNNNVGTQGGGVANSDASPEFINCLFIENSAVAGGALRTELGSPTLINCTFVGNTAQFGGAINGNVANIFDGPTNHTLINCILWGNGAGNEINNFTNATIAASNSIIQSGFAPCTGCPGGDGNVDPLFVDAANGDFTLQQCSPAIDAGDNNALPAGIATDLGGNPRFFNNGTVDLGAYEYQAIPDPCLCIAERTWTGSVSTDWNTDGNWSPACVPTADNPVIIPDVANDPVISASTAALAQSVHVQSGAELSIQPMASLTINGSASYTSPMNFTAGLNNEGTVDNSGELILGSVSSVGDNGIYNQAVFQNNASGHIRIDRSTGNGITNVGTFTNAADITIGAVASLGQYGISNTNSSTFQNNSGGHIRIDRTNGRGISNILGGTFSNDAAITVGALAHVGNFGLYNGSNSSFNNNSGGHIHIDRSSIEGISNYGTFTNTADITIGGTADVGSTGINNNADFTNNPGGHIRIDRSTLAGIQLTGGSASFSNAAEITIGAVGSPGTFGIYIFNSTDIFENNTGGYIRIDRSTNNGISNFGTFTNAADITIGAMASVGQVGISNGFTFQNNSAGHIHIDRSTLEGITNFGTFTNAAEITIGAHESTGLNGLRNNGNFFNNAGGHIRIDRSTNNGLINDFGTFSNAAEITIGSVGLSTAIGIENDASFFNTTGGHIRIDRSTSTGLYNGNSGAFTNTAEITMGISVGPGSDGIQNYGSFDNNPGGHIRIDRSSGTGISNFAGNFTNAADITLGAVAGVGLFGIFNQATFQNEACAQLFMNAPLYNTASFSNTGLFTVTTAGSHINSGLTNDGIIVYPQGNPIPNVTNNDLIVGPVAGCESGLSPALGIGSANSFTAGATWYTDEALSTPAGSYNQSSNTFTSSIGAGTHTLYFSVDGTPGCPRTVPITVNLEEAPTPANAGPDQFGVCGTASLAANTPSVDTGQWSILVEADGQGAITDPTSPTSGFTGTPGQTYTLRWAISNGSSCPSSSDNVDIEFQQSLVSVSVGPLSVDEDEAGNLAYTISRDCASAPITVNFSASGTANFNTDYSQTGAATFDGTTGTVFMDAGVSSVTITFDPVADNNVEPDEHITLTLLSGNGYQLSAGMDTATGTILNDDTATLTISNLEQAETDDGTTNFTFQVALDQAVDLPFTVDFATIDGTATVASGDYTANSGTLTFAGTEMETQFITVAVNGDCLIEADETFTVSLSNLQAGSLDVVFGNTTATGAILNDDLLPSLSCPADFSEVTDLDACYSTIDLPVPAISDACGGTTLEFRTRTTDASQAPVSDWSGWMPSNSSGQAFNAGHHEIEWRVTSGSGTATCSYSLEVRDEQPPAALCQNVTVQLDANGNGSTTAAAVDNGSSDACGIQSLVLSQTGFDCSEVGGNTETLTVTDVNGNVSTCKTTITVEDNIAPTALCLSTTVNLEPNGAYALKPTDVYNAGASSDNCGIASVSFPPVSFTCDQAGAVFPITVTVEDFSGNTDQCIAMVSVEAGNALPPGWAASDIGDQGAGSSYNYDPCASNNPDRGDFTISTGGYNLIPNNSDNLAFMGRELCNNGGIQARIEDVTGGYAGLMIRESNAPGAKMVAVYSNLTSLLRRETRTVDNGPRTSGTHFAPFPYWLRLVRQNDYIRAFYRTSDNGSWTLFHQAYLPMQECVEMGLAVFTTDPNGQADATFSRVQWQSNVGGSSLAIFNEGPVAAQPEEREASVFPNPAREAFTLRFSRALRNGATAILRNQMGQALEQRQLLPGEAATDWDISRLPGGLYFLEVRREGGPPQVLRVVKAN